MAVQGDFEAHAAMLEQLGVETAEVRTPADLDCDCDGLYPSRRRSTTQLQFLQEEGLHEAILKFAEQGGANLRNLRRAILLATKSRILSRTH